MKSYSIIFFFVTLLCLSFGACVQDALVLDFESYGLIKFGMMLEVIENAIGDKAVPSKYDPGCDYVTFPKYPEMKFMVEEGVVTRGEALDPNIPNTLGISIGSTLSEIKKRYPSVVIEPHKYDPTGHYLIFKSSDGERAIVLEEGDGKITDIRAGIEPSVEYVEGCL